MKAIAQQEFDAGVVQDGVELIRYERERKEGVVRLGGPRSQTVAARVIVPPAGSPAWRLVPAKAIAPPAGSPAWRVKIPSGVLNPILISKPRF